MCFIYSNLNSRLNVCTVKIDCSGICNCIPSIKSSGILFIYYNLPVSHMEADSPKMCLIAARETVVLTQFLTVINKNP